MTSNSSDDVAHVRFVNFRFSGVRKHTSIRCDSNLWKTFVEVCKKNGLSTCDVLEKLILGFLVGINEMCHKPTTIYVTVDAPRVVKRVRRRQLVFEDEVFVEEVRRPRCFFCRREAVGRFRFKPSGAVVNLCRVHAEEFKYNYELVEEFRKTDEKKSHPKWKVEAP